MKVQFDGQGVRVRLAVAELAALREGATVEASAPWLGSVWLLRLAAGDALAVEDGVRVTLPRADLDALSARLPAKDGLRYIVDGASGSLELTVEVDLHDGRRRPR